MSAFGQTLFGGSRRIRWSLTPFALLFAVVMPLLDEQWTLIEVIAHLPDGFPKLAPSIPQSASDARQSFGSE